MGKKCHSCPKPAAPGRSRCPACAEKSRDYLRARRAAGTCGSCPKPALPGKGSCRSCYAQRAKRRSSEYSETRKAGRCGYSPHCETPVAAGHSYCPEHLAYVNRTSATLRRRKRAEKWVGHGI